MSVTDAICLVYFVVFGSFLILNCFAALALVLWCLLTEPGNDKEVRT